MLYLQVFINSKLDHLILITCYFLSFTHMYHLPFLLQLHIISVKSKAKVKLSSL